jgi:RNA polymerase sigma-70 factor (ECF subfamily)
LARAARYKSAVQSDAIMILPITEPGNAAEMNAFQRARTGDVSAFEQLLDSHQRSVLRLAARLTGNLDDAKDISQEVFLKLHRELKRLRSDAEVAPWLYRVTINACFDAKRKVKRSRLTAISDDAGTWRSSDPTPEDTVSRQQDRQMLEAGLQTLSDRERSAIALRELEGLSTAEVAHILGSTESTVRVQISNARVKLRKFFEKVRGRSV